MIDNKSRRTFANAAVNSVIALLGAVQTKPDAGLAKTARFVQFAVPFEAALDAGVWQHIENAQERTTTLDFRVMPVPQQVLLDDGIPTTALAADDAEEPLKPGQYAGNKWGGKYLRAPDIYYTLLDKGRDKLVRLGDIARIRRGFTTGANEFFYLDDQTIARWSIEPAYIAPAIKSPRETQRITLDA